MSWLASFFSNQETRPPGLSPLTFLFFFAVLFTLTYATLRWYQNKAYQDFFKGLQLLQIILLYGWYITMAFSLKESLPFYHCRMSVMAVLFLPDKHPWKRYFIMIGLIGSILSFAYPLFDHYPIGHVTIFSYVVGHFTLFVNCLIYLLRFHGERMEMVDLVTKTVLLHFFLLAVNTVTGGNYGFLHVTPLIGNLSAPIRFILVTLVMVFLLSSVDWLFATKIEALRDYASQEL